VFFKKTIKIRLFIKKIDAISTKNFLKKVISAFLLKRTKSGMNNLLSTLKSID